MKSEEVLSLIWIGRSANHGRTKKLSKDTVANCPTNYGSSRVLPFCSCPGTTTPCWNFWSVWPQRRHCLTLIRYYVCSRDVNLNCEYCYHKNSVYYVIHEFKWSTKRTWKKKKGKLKLPFFFPQLLYNKSIFFLWETWVCFSPHWTILKWPLKTHCTYTGLEKITVLRSMCPSVEVNFVHQVWMWWVASASSLTGEVVKQNSVFVHCRWNKRPLRPPIQGSSVLSICANFAYSAPCKWRLSCLPLFDA